MNKYIGIDSIEYENEEVALQYWDNDKPTTVIEVSPSTTTIVTATVAIKNGATIKGTYTFDRLLNSRTEAIKEISALYR